jgi:hypothetical protein
VVPGDRRTGGHRLQQRRSGLGIGSLGDLLGQVEVVPADDRVLDQPLALAVSDRTVFRYLAEATPSLA